MSFQYPADFIWGVAASAAQIEGASEEGGRTPSIWDSFSSRPGAILDGSSPAVACDHYHRYEEDIALMRRLGVNGYRLSISWSRIFPDGGDRANPEGIAFYHRLLDCLGRNGIGANLTLYHWDLPQALQERGGWANRDTVDAFERYARLCFKEYDSKASHWVTHNEMQVVVECGHRIGCHAPGIRDDAIAWKALRNLQLSHGRAVAAYREIGGARPIGLVCNLSDYQAASASQADLWAAEYANDFHLGLYADPIFLGRYPENVVERLRASGAWEEPSQEELSAIGARGDFLGLNYYSGNLICGNDEEGRPLGGIRPFREMPSDRERTEIGWDIEPAGLTRVLAHMARRYPGLGLMVTENGAAYRQGPDSGGRVRDQARVDYLASHLNALAEAVASGLPVRGYYHWSLLDNFEWSCGYNQRFGLVYVDFKSLKRLPKDSFHFYADYIQGARRGPLAG